MKRVYSYTIEIYGKPCNEIITVSKDEGEKLMSAWVDGDDLFIASKVMAVPHGRVALIRPSRFEEHQDYEDSRQIDERNRLISEGKIEYRAIDLAGKYSLLPIADKQEKVESESNTGLQKLSDIILNNSLFVK